MYNYILIVFISTNTIQSPQTLDFQEFRGLKTCEHAAKVIKTMPYHDRFRISTECVRKANG